MPIISLKATHTAYVYVLLTTVLWAANAIAGKLAVGHISPFLLTCLRWWVVVIVMLPFAVAQLKKDWPQLRHRLAFMFALGSIGFAGFNNLMYLALESTSAINVAIIQSATPLFVFILNYALFRINSTRFQVVGFLLTAVGVAVIAFQGRLAMLFDLNVVLGDLLMLTAVLAYATYSVLLKNKPNIHWLSMMFVLAVSAAFASLPFVAYEASQQTINFPDLTGWLVVLYAALLSSIVAQSLWIRSVELIGSNTAGVFINLVPLFGSLMAVLLLGEVFKLFHATGIALILVGTLLATFYGGSKTALSKAPTQRS